MSYVTEEKISLCKKFYVADGINDAPASSRFLTKETCRFQLKHREIPDKPPGFLVGQVQGSP